MALPRFRIDRLVELVRKTFPGWTGFDDPRFEKDEVDYKQRTIAKAKEFLSRDEMSRLIDAGRFADLRSRIEAVGKDNNLLWNNVPQQGDLAIVLRDDLDWSWFGPVFLDLLHGPGSSAQRLDRYAQAVLSRKLPNRWAFPTYFLFVSNPKDEIIVKPTPIRWFLELLGSSVQLSQGPTGQSYEAVSQLARDLGDSMAEYGPRDMVDIQGLIWVCAKAANSGVQYWKIAPGENASQWEERRRDGFIGIGWEELGDVSGLTRTQFNARRDEMLAQHDDWTKTGTDQVWTFATAAKEGDRIVANKGIGEVVGVGTVVGPYTYLPDTRYGHRLHVKWDEFEPCRLARNRAGWERTIVKLKQEDFEEVTQPTDGSPKEAVAPIKPSVGAVTGCPFSTRTFELLDELGQYPTRAFYSERREEFKQYVEEPLHGLLRQVATQLPHSMKASLETERNLFARILKNDFGLGGAWTYYWGAFYPKGGKRTEDAQLFMWIDSDRLEIGFSIGDYGSNQRSRFLRNCEQNQEALSRVLADSLSADFAFGQHDGHLPQVAGLHKANPKVTWRDWVAKPGNYGIHAAIILPSSEVLSLASEGLVSRMVRAFRRLFPLVLLATSDVPMPAIDAYLEEEFEHGPNPVYPLSQVAADTGLDEVTLARWVRAIERKGQAVFYGPPGTGKTFIAERLAKHLVSGGHGFWELVQFHPAYSYEDFVLGIRPQSDQNGCLRYPMIPGRFLDFCDRARTRDDTCVLIIDEINRANLAQVLGELMYLLEYRDRDIPLSGGQAFGIPSNVRIIGTMNTADRSIALVDHALRRRFAFLALLPDYEVLRRYHQKTAFAVDGLISVLKNMNAQIDDHNYEVGISFFLRGDVADHIEDIWRMEIEPYLEEYFFNQRQKVEDFRWDRVAKQVLS